jgi:hypothetical protein
MFLALEDKGFEKEASPSIVFMSGKDLFKEARKNMRYILLLLLS